MEFSKLTLDCIDSLRNYFRNNQCRICDCTAGGTFIWRDYFNTHYAQKEGVLYLKVRYTKHGTAFAAPRSSAKGADLEKEVYEPIIEYCETEGIPVKICAVSEAVKNKLMTIYPQSTVYTDRDWSDYLYTSDQIVNLTGRKYSGQRNHINRFKRENPEWVFEAINEQNVEQVRAFYIEYAANNVREYKAYDEGNRKAVEVLDNYEKYGLPGGLLRVGEKVIGAAIGEIVDDTLYVHVEKADTLWHGSYPMLVNQFARYYVTENIKYINREEDDGVEGLRTSKLSYHPTELLSKYIVEIKD